ncbi:MAG: hypothetical protein KGN36_03520 [Acidobacteriota bacterium]|nr:hypothetical protein [Acidobacteriota bacterium]
MRYRLAFAFLITLATANAGNIVQNPGFEDPTLDFWTSSGFNLISSTSHSGTQSVTNTSCAFGCSDSISQLLTTTAGATYDLAFWAYTTNVNNPSPEVVVSWNGTAVFDKFIAATASGPFVQYTVSGLTASGLSTSLQFNIAPAGHLYLDDVSVSPSAPASSSAPEPSAFAMISSALVALAGVRGIARRRGRAA